MKRRPRGVLIKVEDYSPTPKYEDKDFKYMGAFNGTGPYAKFMRKRCVICGGFVDFIGISHGNGYTRLERFCNEYARTHGSIIPVKLKVEK